MEELKSDVIVVGGGAAGLMAAGRAASMGAKVLLIEKMKKCGRKLRITGKGRCNLTNVAPLSEFLKHVGGNGKFLRGVFSRFFSKELVDFFSLLGVETITERGGRVFPASEEAGDVVDALLKWVLEQGVKIVYETRVEKLLLDKDEVIGVETNRGIYKSRSLVLATGGSSYPGTGSTGDGYKLCEQVGHTIELVRPSLVPLVTSGGVAEELQGLSLRNVRCSVRVNGRRTESYFGEMLFTHFGVSGPIILTMSREVVGCLLEKKSVQLEIDLKPAIDDEQLETRLLRELNEHGKMKFHTFMKGYVPSSMIDVCCKITEISGEKYCNQITGMERKRLRLWLKNFSLEVVSYRSFDEAIITAGGVSVKEIDGMSMESRVAKNMFLAGELIDVDADTGGYNLQIAFSTGWIAGEYAAKLKSV